MANLLWNLEFLNLNSQRSYPLAEDATKRDTTGAFTLPDDFLVGLYFPVHAALSVDADRFFIRAIAVFATGYVISIGYHDGSASPPIVASTIVSRATHTLNASYALPGMGDFDDSAGKIVIGRLDSIDLQPTGQFLFDYAGGKLDSDAVRPMIRGVQALRVVTNGEPSPPIYGDIYLTAGRNFQISVASLDDDSAEIRFDAVDGAGLTEDCVCDDTSGPPIRKINGIPPRPDGTFDLIGNQCLDISALASGLRLSDTCSSPCCGCTELEQLTRELEVLGSAEATTSGFVGRLAAEMTQFSQVILGSRLNDSGCIEC
jgi:hypothetical protein